MKKRPPTRMRTPESATPCERAFADAPIAASAVTLFSSSRPTRPTPTLSHLAHITVGRFQQQRDKDDDDDQVDLGDHGRVADVRAIAIFSVDETRDRVRRAAGAAGRDIDDDIGELELENDSDHDRGHADGQHQREDDRRESLPGAGAVDLGRLFYVVGQGLQAGEHHRAEFAIPTYCDSDEGPRVDCRTSAPGLLTGGLAAGSRRVNYAV